MPTITYEAKYGVRDYRGGGRQSARETATRVAAGAIARKVLDKLYGKVTIRGALVQMGTQKIDARQLVLGRGEQQSLLLPGRQGGAGMGRLSGRHPQERLIGRRHHRSGGRRHSRRAWARRSMPSWTMNWPAR